MLSAMLGAPTRIRDGGSGTEYSGSKRSELLTDTVVLASTRVVLAAARGAAAALAEFGATTAGPVLSGAGAAFKDCCTTTCSVRAATIEADAGTGAPGVEVEADGLVETTTVDDLTRVVDQFPAAADVVGEDVGAGAVVCADTWPAPVDGALDPAGATGVGAACFAAITVVSERAEIVVSERAAPGFAALRTLSVGRAGEADRAVASRTCSIIAVKAAGEFTVRLRWAVVPSD